MIRLWVVDAQGELLRGLLVPDEATANLNIRPGESRVDSAPVGDSWWDGLQWVAKPAKPGEWAVWDAEEKIWVDPRTLDDLKASQWASMKAERDWREYGTFSWDGSVFDCDRDSTAKIMGAVQTAMIAAQAGQSFSVDWTLADNTVRTLSGADLIAAGATLTAQVSSIYSTGRTLRDEIEAATTAEDVLAVAWPA
jgi:hypothetical protein